MEALEEENPSDETGDVAESNDEYPTLEKGSKGEEVKKLQQRLKDLNYLSGGIDGSYGNGTASAISLFQQEAGLTANGIADSETQKALFADDAPKAKVYEKLNYKSVLRDPDAYTGKYFKFTGKVFQLVTEQSYGDTIYTVLFIASNGKYGDLCQVTYERPKESPRILEDDKVTVYAQCDGLYTYETVRGNSNTILDFTADNITN